MRILLILGTLLVVSVPCMAQTDALEEGRQAFREERYEDAAKIFERVANEDAENAEAHFLVARIYFETPLKDNRKARLAIERAMKLDPDNVEFMVARLEQYREESWNFITDRLREARRLDLSRKILKLDPDNAFAHEELGVVNIRDFWRYRNAIMLPTLTYGYLGAQRQQASAAGNTNLDFEENITIDELLEQESLESTTRPSFDAILPDQVFLNDQFDIPTLRDQGVPVLNLAARANRAYERATGHLKKALESDPRRRSVYDEMMEVYALKGEYEEALLMLDEMHRFFPDDPDLWRYLGLTHYQLGDMDAADRSFDTAFEYMEKAEVQAYHDLHLFLTSEEETLQKVDSVAFAARFWTSQDPRFLTPYNERKLEHYFRLTYADLLYGSPGLNLRGWDTQRGQILARYGPPVNDVVLVPNSTGVFSARETLVGAITSTIDGTDDVGLSTSGRQLSGTSSFGSVLSTSQEAFEELNTYNIWEYGVFRFVFEDPFRNGEYRLYTPPAEANTSRINTWKNDYIIRANETFRETPQKYEYEAPGRQINLPFLVTTFKGEEHTTDLYVHYGVPISDFDPSQERIEVTANMGMFLVNKQHEILVERRRTIYGLPTDQIVTFQEQNLWVDTQQMEAPPGNHDVSVEFETTSGQTVGTQRRTVTVLDFDSDQLAVSDIMLAYRVEDTPDGRPLGLNEVARGNLSILPAPWSVYATNWPIYLYFEVYNLESNPEGETDYSVEILLRPKDTRRGISRLLGNLFGGAQGVAVSYESGGAQADEALYQILDASEEETGVYTLTLRVRDNISGRSAERQQDLFLEG